MADELIHLIDRLADLLGRGLFLIGEAVGGLLEALREGRRFVEYGLAGGLAGRRAGPRGERLEEIV